MPDIAAKALTRWKPPWGNVAFLPNFPPKVLSHEREAYRQFCIIVQFEEVNSVFVGSVFLGAFTGILSSFAVFLQFGSLEIAVLTYILVGMLVTLLGAINAGNGPSRPGLPPLHRIMMR